MMMRMGQRGTETVDSNQRVENGISRSKSRAGGSIRIDDESSAHGHLSARGFLTGRSMRSIICPARRQRRRCSSIRCPSPTTAAAILSRSRRHGQRSEPWTSCSKALGNRVDVSQASPTWRQNEHPRPGRPRSRNRPRTVCITATLFDEFELDNLLLPYIRGSLPARRQRV